MKIGNLDINGVTVLAPLAGVTNLPFRRFVRQSGCGLVCSEMISANGLIHGSAKTRILLASDPGEKPVSFQIFGANPDIMGEAAAMVAAAGADIIDINCGCAVKKILKSGSGAALMKSPDTARRVFTSVRRAIRVPLTVKLRSGWDKSGKDGLLMGRIAEDCGADAVILHPRSASQGFSGHADWGLITRLKNQLHIPVIGNGDILRPEDAARMLAETGCDGVMVGRAAMNNPWIFVQIEAYLATGRYERVSPDQREAAMKQLLAASAAAFGETIACRMMRSRLPWLVRGLPGASRFRSILAGIHTLTEALDVITAYFKGLSDNAVREPV